MAKTDHLLLKWGTVKGWNFETTDCEAFELLKKYMEGSAGGGCAMDRPDEERKKLLLQLIDAFDGEIQNDWTGEMMTRKEAREYISEYGT